MIRADRRETVSTALARDVHNPSGTPTIVLLHSLALDRSIWDDVVPLLPATAAVVTPDLPGHGTAPAGDPTSVESMADEVAGLLRDLDRGPVVLVGMSLGGSVAQAVAIRHAQSVSALGLVDTTAWYGEEAPAMWAARADRAMRHGLGSLAESQLGLWFTEDFRADRPEVCERLLDIFRRTGVDDYVRSCRALGAMDLRADLPRISVPTAIVVGELDGGTPPAHARALQHAIGGSVLTVIPRCGHLSAIERPHEVLAGLEPVLGSALPAS